MFVNRTQRLVQRTFVPAIVIALLLLLHSRVAVTLPAVGNRVVPTTAPAAARICEAPRCGAPGRGGAAASAPPLGFGRVLGACAVAGVGCTPVATLDSATPIATR